MVTVIPVAGPLTAALRAEIAAGLARADGPVLLALASAGLPLDEVGTPAAVDAVAALCRDIAARDRVIAALSGDVAGAALELALAATGRVAEAGARFSFPDITLGLVPAAGATQRLPQLTGGAEALRMLLTGTTVTAIEALASGLVDRVVEGDPLIEGRSYATGGPVPKRRGLRDGRGFLAAVAEARRGADGMAQAAARMVDCVEMALMLPLEQGLAFERVCFADLAAGDESRGLRHAAAVSAQGGGVAVSVGRVGIWGGGAAAVDLVVSALAAGLVVQLAAADRGAVVRALADVAERQEAAVQSGLLTAARRDEDWARLLPQVGVEGVAGVDLTVLTEQGDVAGPAVAIGIAPPRGAVALVRLDRLAEVQGAGASDGDLARVLGFARAMGWDAVVTGAGGSVALRLAGALSDAVLWAETQGIPRHVVAQSLAAAGIATDGGRMQAPPDALALRCLAALANAGARAIEAGEAPSAAHVDAVALAAGLMARWTGGPMHQADRRGLMVLRRDLRDWQADDAALWAPAALIDALVAEGRGFTPE